MIGFQDEGRAVLSVGGVDARPLLQDLVTNDLGLIDETTLIYAALLTPQGKYLFDFFMGEAAGELFIDVAADRAASLAQRLSLYKLRRDMTISAADRPVTLIWGGADEAPPAGARRDPRDDRLGWRCYGDAPTGFGPASRADYDALRVALATPETGAELIENDTYILEAGFERLRGVDFRKGCYVGQEVTARMKHKTKLKKGLVRVSVDGAATPGAPITVDGKPAGVLHTIAGNEGLAHVRFDRATGDMSAGEAVLRRIG